MLACSTPARVPAISRRRFLQGAAAGFTATGLLVPVLLPGRARGAARQTPPSERITLGFIGVGKMNRGHLAYFLGQDDVQVLAVCDVDTTRRQHAQQTVDQAYAQARKDGQYSGCAAYQDFRELLARPDIEAVVIGTPDHWHAIPAIVACQAGKDVYCEKPLSLTIHEAKRMLDAARKFDRVFQTGSQQRSSHEFRLACELVRSGRLGKLQSVVVNVGGPSKWCDLPGEPVEAGLDWDFWLGPAPHREYNSVLSPRGVHDHFPAWRNYREYSGGMMTDWGAHHFDIAQWGLDRDGSGPVEIIPPDDPAAERGVRYVYDNGVEVVHGDGGGVTFVGEAGEIVVNRGQLHSQPAEILQQPLGESDVHLYESPGHQRDWLNCIRSRQRPICDVEIGARSVTVCHLGNLAYWNHRRLKWDPQQWQFAGDDDAQQWLDRERRDPWQLPST